MALIDDVKTVIRISHARLNDDITRNIATAKLELKRLGISEAKANDETDKLITEAIITYCQYKYASNEKLQDGYLESWQYQTDNLRKSSDYKAVIVDV